MSRSPTPAYVSSSFPVIAFFLLLTLLYFFPLLRSPHQLPFPTIKGDLGQTLWNFWWVKTALFQGTNPYFCPILYYPVGSWLVFHTLDPLYTVFTLPLQVAVGIVPCYNAVVILSFFLTLVSTYVAVRALAPEERWGAVLAAVMLATCAFRFAHLHQPRPLSTFWTPLWFMFLWRVLTKGSGLKHVFFLALIGWGLLLTSWYHLIFCVWLAFFYLIYRGLEGYQWWNDKRFWKRLGIFLALVSPWLIFNLAMMLKAGERGARAGVDLAVKIYWSADLLNYLIPPYLEEPAKQLLYGSRAHLYLEFWGIKTSGEFAIFPGMVLWLLVLCVLLRKPRKNRHFFWVAAAAAFLLLSLGPILKIGTPLYLGKDVLFYLPGYLVNKIPLVNLLKHLSRYSFMVLFCLSMFCALNLNRVLAWFEKTLNARAWMWGSLLILLVLLENWRAPLPAHPVRVENFYREIGQEHDTYSLLEYPRGDKEWDGEYMFHQTVHHKLLVGGYISRGANLFESFAQESLLFNLLQVVRESQVSLALNPEGVKELKQELKKLKLRFLILHYDKLPGEEARAIEETLQKTGLFHHHPASSRRASIWETDFPWDTEEAR